MALYIPLISPVRCFISLISLIIFILFSDDPVSGTEEETVELELRDAGHLRDQALL